MLRHLSETELRAIEPGIVAGRDPVGNRHSSAGLAFGPALAALATADHRHAEWLAERLPDAVIVRLGLGARFSGIAGPLPLAAAFERRGSTPMVGTLRQHADALDIRVQVIALGAPVSRACRFERPARIVVALGYVQRRFLLTLARPLHKLIVPALRALDERQPLVAGLEDPVDGRKLAAILHVGAGDRELR